MYDCKNVDMDAYSVRLDVAVRKPKDSHVEKLEVKLLFAEEDKWTWKVKVLSG